jgi:hypothetical protein
VPPPSHLTSCTHTKSNLYLDSSLEPYITHTKSHIHILSLRSFIERIRSGPRLFYGFRNKFISSVKSISPMLNLQTRGPPLVVFPRLLLQYIRSYPPSLRAVPPSATRGWVIIWFKESRLRLIIIDSCVSALKLRLSTIEISLQLSGNITLFAVCHIYTDVFSKET